MKALFLTLALATGLPAAPKPATHSIAQDFGSMEVSDLLEVIRDRRDRVDKKVFEELAARGSKAALEALFAGSDLVTGQWPLRYAFQSISSFKDNGKLAEEALDFLYAQAELSNTRRSSAAAHALGLFGDAAHKKLQRILKTAKDPLTRSAALAPLIPQLVAEGGKASFKTIYENFVLTYKVHRPLGVETFKAFAESEGAELFSKKLTDKKIRPDVRGMMITALEATPGESATLVLMSALKAKEPRIVYEAIRSLERRGADSHRDALKKLLRHKDSIVRHAAITSSAKLSIGDPSFIDRTLDLAEDKNPVNRGAAAIALGVLRTPEAIAALHSLLRDEEYTVRSEAIIGTSEARSRTSVAVLASRLDQTEGVERDRLHRALRLLTGQDFGTKSNRWLKWWEAEGEGFSLPSREESREADKARERRRESSETTSSFFGLDISSDRACFVLDLSGSMNFKTKSGKTRLARLKTEMDSFLERFPAGDLFNIIFFGNDAERWRPQLSPMTDELRRKTRAHIKSLDAPGATAVYDGLEAAFEDPLIDTIYLLTDGSPSGGTVDDIDEIIMEVSRWNSLRHVVIHSVAVGRDSPLLRRLSADSHGDYIRVD